MCLQVVPISFCNISQFFLIYIDVFYGILIFTAYGKSPVQINSEQVEFSEDDTFLVDKTTFIKEVIFQENKTLLITAPTGFGKTTNLKMLRCFLEVEVDNNGSRRTMVDPSKEPITDTRNYYKFVNNSYKITEYKNIMDDYFGKHPVINLNFECFAVIESIEDAVRFYRRAVHSSFKDHVYLSRSERLSLNERKFVKFWCDDHNYFKMSRHQVLTGVRELSRLLYRHFNSRSWVLVDDYDSLVQAAMLEVTDPEDFRRVLKFTSILISYVFRNNSDCVSGGVVTGVCPISLFNSTGNLQSQMCTFMGDHQFVEFYGLTLNEVENMFTNIKTQHNNSLAIEAEVNCGGYKTKTGKKVYNFCLITHLLEARRKNFVQSVGIKMSDLTNTLKIPLIRETMERVLRGEIVTFHYDEIFSEDDLMKIRTMLLKPESTITDVVYKQLLSYIFHEGFITYTSTNQTLSDFDNRIHAKVPNKVIEKEINLQFKLTTNIGIK